jgi:ATP-dependent Lon protease
MKDVVVFPHMVLPLFVGRAASTRAVDNALSGDRHAVFVTQKDDAIEFPTFNDLYHVGTVGLILRMLKQSDGQMKLLVQGVKRVSIKRMEAQEDGSSVAVYDDLDSIKPTDEFFTEARMRSVKEQLIRLVGMGKPVLPDFVDMLNNINDPEQLSNILSANIGIPVSESQEMLEMLDPLDRLERISEYFNRELSIMQVQQKIIESAKGEIDKNQRDYFLREQLKAIQRELGERGAGGGTDSEEYEKKIIDAKMPEEAEKEARKQLKRLSYLSQDSAEGSVVRTYLDTLCELPWSKSTKEVLQIKKAKRVLDNDHYGIVEVKERVLDFLALRKLKKDIKSPILCLVGPPGVGKTSLGRSIAKALNRNFVRMSFGGIRDEAEIRGHRRTYIGSLPGKIIQGIKSAGSSNPVIMLDEIDKLGTDFRGDPASALLEVLDPVQNSTFTDHYLGLPFDLSHVLFITTANYIDPIPEPLKDRMEIIRISGYTEEEKLIIAQRYIIPRQIEESGLDKVRTTFRKEAVRDVIAYYTRESGLRKLEQQISKICRKIGREVVENHTSEFFINPKSLRKYLGVRQFTGEEELEKNEVGIATGLAWTPAGGETLFVECAAFKGKGALQQTGMIGDVMKESMLAAYTYIKSIAEEFKISEKTIAAKDLHIHVPSGAIPKDGPSAGVTMATAIFSVLTGRAVKKDVAMTGEITITGKVLPIGGLKEKLYAARRIGVKTVIIPKRNEPELSDMPKLLLANLNIIPVSSFKEVLPIAIENLY